MREIVASEFVRTKNGMSLPDEAERGIGCKPWNLVFEYGSLRWTMRPAGKAMLDRQQS
jgi:hypothetical protein